MHLLIIRIDLFGNRFYYLISHLLLGIIVRSCIIALFCLATVNTSFAVDFSISSYNCGGLSNHYDYLRAVCMQKIVKMRFDEEPKEMALLEKIQNCALKILFSDDVKAKKEWKEGDYDSILSHLITHPYEPNSPNAKWQQLVAKTLTSYKVRPVIIHDEEINNVLLEHVKDLTRDVTAVCDDETLRSVRSIMAKRIFAQQLSYDIIALQEGNYVDRSLFPENYEVFLSKDTSPNGIAWNKDRFELVECIGNILQRGFAVRLLERSSGKIIAVLSAHLSGCNPFCEIQDAKGRIDSSQGDQELTTFLTALENMQADIKVIAMDSNVTATHPRLAMLKEVGFMVDYEHYLEPTCTNPWQVLDTRIDWIAVKSSENELEIVNIPILSVGLHSLQTNMSDHKPIAAMIHTS